MVKVKGCINVNCEAYTKKVPSNERFCSQCGSELMYVCKGKNCNKVLEETDGAYCVMCMAMRKDKRDKVVKQAGAIAGAVATVAISAASKGKDIANAVSRFKK